MRSIRPWLFKRADASEYGLPRTTPGAQAAGRQEAAKRLLQLLAAGAATGVGFRSVAGLRDLLQPSPQIDATGGQLGYPVTMPPLNVPADDRSRRRRQKLAATGGAASSTAAPASMIDRIAKTIADKKLFPVPRASNVLKDEFYLPAAVATLGAGTLGGYKLTDWLLGKEQEHEHKNELAAAEQDYRAALAEQYRRAMMAKQGSDDFGLTELSETYAKMSPQEKQASLSMPRILLGEWADEAIAKYWPAGVISIGRDNWELMKGLGNLAILGTALGTGKVTYDMTRSGNRRQLLEKALKRRQATRLRNSPAPLLVLPDATEEVGDT